MSDFYKVLRFIGAAFLLLAITLHSANATMYKARIDVMVDSTKAIVFRFVSDTGTDVPINTFSVVGQTYGKYDYQKPAWFLAISPGTYKRVSEIRYGQQVDGFPRSDAQHLIEGRRYQASIDGAGISESIEFELVRCLGKLAIRVLKAN